jgi:precorrin-2 dehydrogenase/sirohydrochlorin ferrochelatase
VERATDNSLLPVYPVALLVAGHSCLVVGGGQVARRKAAGLLEAAARVTVVAPDVVAELADLPLEIERRRYRAGEAANYFLVCTATGIDAVDGAVAADCAGAGVLVNAADDPQHCSYLLPATHRVGPVTISVSTSGASPGLAVWLRDRLATTLDVDIERLAELAVGARAAVRDGGQASEGLPWGALFDDLTAALRSGPATLPESIVATFVARAREQRSP